VISPNYNEADARQFYQFLDHKHETEIRLIDPHNRTPPRSIHITKEQEFVDETKKADGTWNVYAGINERRAKGTKKEDVIRIKKIFADIDPIRQPNTVATEEQKQKAHIVAQMITTWCEEEGFTQPTILDSGNGLNIYWHIPEIEINDSNREKIDAQTQAFCRYLNRKFNTPEVKIDQTGDLSRIMKVPGTTNIKGVNSPDNPWRTSKILKQRETKEDTKLLLFILTLQSEEKKPQIIIQRIAATQDIETLKHKDSKLNRLLSGDTQGYQSRSEAELALLTKLLMHQVPETQALTYMDSAIGKWATEHQNYRDRTLEKAREYASKHIIPEKHTSFQEVVDVFKKWLYLENEDDIYIVAGVFLSHELKGDPVWLFILGPSSDGKTEILRAFVNGKTELIQSLSPRTLISGYNPLDKNRRNYDLAPKLHNKILMVYDFTEILNKRSEERNEIFSQLRSLYDGTINKIMGNGIHVTYGKGTPDDPKLYCTLIAACTPIIDIYVNEQSVLGSRHIFYRKKTVDQMKVMNKIDELKSEDRDTMRDDIHETVLDYFKSNQILKTDLEATEALWLKQEVETLAKLRAGAKYNNFTDELDEPITPENTSRLFIMLKKLLLGLKNIDTMDSERLDRLMKKVIKSTIPEKRLVILEHLWNAEKTEYSIDDIAHFVKLGRRTVKRELNFFFHLGYAHKRVEWKERQYYPTEWYSFNEAKEEELKLLFGGQTNLG
jgi:hypothetical protein